MHGAWYNIYLLLILLLWKCTILLLLKDFKHFSVNMLVVAWVCVCVQVFLYWTPAPNEVHRFFFHFIKICVQVNFTYRCVRVLHRHVCVCGVKMLGLVQYIHTHTHAHILLYKMLNIQTIKSIFAHTHEMP